MKMCNQIVILLLIIFNAVLLESVYAESFSNYSSVGGSAERLPNKKVSKTCKNYICGPTSTIELSMTSSPDVSSYNYDIGENSTFEQMMKMGENFEKFGPASVVNQMGTFNQNLTRRDKEKQIKIEIPMIDYGFSGTLNNILISVSGKGRGYSSIVRGLTSKDDHIEYTGSITIEKYTPFLLKGSYSAPLKRYKPILGQDMRLVGRPDRFCPAFSDPSTPPCTSYTLEGTGKISGQFNILSPWRDDDRLNDNIDMNSSFVDPLKNDIRGMIAKFGIDIDVDKEFARIDLGKGSNSSSSSGSTGGKDFYGGCNCSCNFAQSTTTQCKVACSAAFSACSGVRYKPPNTAIVSTNPLEYLFPELSAKVVSPEVKGVTLLGINQDFIDSIENNTIKIPQNLRKKYILLLEQKMPGKNTAAIREMMLMGFDEMPDDKSRMIMFKSTEGM